MQVSNRKDPRGVPRKIVSVVTPFDPGGDSSCTFITFDCGHVGRFNPVFTYSGTDNLVIFCSKCVDEPSR